MKLIVLNIWGTRRIEELPLFFQKYIDTDVFLFQEYYTPVEGVEVGHLRHDVPAEIPNHKSFLAPALESGFGLAAFIKNELQVVAHGETIIHEGRKDDPDEAKYWTDIAKNLQYVTISNSREIYHLFHVHGLWTNNGKGDTESRVQQSQKIIDFIKNFEGKKILGGDFNLRPDTQSVKMIEEQLDMRNLITEYEIPTTRTSLYTRGEPYADFVFVSKDITVNDFKVLPEEVSDHAALYVDFE